MVILPRESKFSHQDLYSKSSLMCSILELVRTAFPAAGGEPHELQPAQMNSFRRISSFALHYPMKPWRSMGRQNSLKNLESLIFRLASALN